MRSFATWWAANSTSIYTRAPAAARRGTAPRGASHAGTRAPRHQLLAARRRNRRPGGIDRRRPHGTVPRVVRRGRHPPAAAVTVCGQAMRIRSPRDAVRAGLALIPEDRQRTGLATALPISYNFTMASLNQRQPLRISQPPRRAQDRRRLYRAPPHSRLFRQTAGGTTQRRQSAESGHREMAGGTRPRFSVRRAHARHRRRRPKPKFSK